MNKMLPHDTLFKHKFSHKEAVEGFLRNRLPQELAERLDFTTLTQKPDTFLPADYLGSKAADVLWAVHTKGGKEMDFLLHFEGEGTPQQMAMRVLGYQVKIGETFVRKNPGKTIPTTITFVLYYGVKPWIGPTSIGTAYKDFASQVAYGFENHFLINLRETPVEELVRDGQAAAAEIAFAGRAQDQLLQVLQQSLGIRSEKCCEQAIINYYLLLHEGKERLVLKEIAKFDPAKADYYRTMFETLTDRLTDRLTHRLTNQLTVSLTAQLKGRFLQQGMQRGMREIIDALKQEGIDGQALQRAAAKVKTKRVQQ